MPYPDKELDIELEERNEIRCQGLNHFYEALKGWDNGQRARLTFEDYLKGEAEMHIHYVFRVSDLETSEFCAVLKLHKSKLDFPVKYNCSIFNRVCLDAYAICNGNGGEEKFVFVSDVKVMKETEGVLIPAASIIERLQRLDHCECALSNPVLEVLSPLKGSCVFDDGEVHGGVVFLNDSGVVPLNQNEEQVVKRSSGVVDAVPNDQRPRDDIGNGVDFEIENELPGLVVRSLKNGIGFTFSAKGGDSRLESLKVFLCPSNLGAKSNGQFSYDLTPYYGEG